VISDKLKILIFIFITVINTAVSAQVKIRLFSNQSPESVVFSVTNGKYEVVSSNGETIVVNKGGLVSLSKNNGKLAIKTMNKIGILCDSVKINGLTGNDGFSLRINGSTPLRQFYSGDLHCFADLGTIVLINVSDIERYISGVVKSEGGNGKNKEYYKTQAVIARTYMYKYFDKHLTDRYNLCDNTHCQAYNGLSSDTIINNAVYETENQVILDKDSILIIAAFHSNCGGETATSEDVWLANQPYLKSVTDPYCIASRNSKWEKTVKLTDWIDILKKSGYQGSTEKSEVFNFVQNTRVTDYRTGSFSLPLRTIRTELNLRSTFFSVAANGGSVVLKGRGYGHGVGLCQEGAMVMAAKGFSYKKIIDFYYSGVWISDIKNAVILPESPPTTLKGG
jgi:stage II sporulation protein D